MHKVGAAPHEVAEKRRATTAQGNGHVETGMARRVGVIVVVLHHRSLPMDVHAILFVRPPEDLVTLVVAMGQTIIIMMPPLIPLHPDYSWEIIICQGEKHNLHHLGVVPDLTLRRATDFTQSILVIMTVMMLLRKVVVEKEKARNIGENAIEVPV